MMRGSEAVAQVIQEVSGCLFGLMADSNLRLVESFIGAGGAYLPATTEATVIGMADGYARGSGRTAFATVSQGPGLTNSVTHLMEAVKARSHVVVLTSSAPPDHLQSLDVAGVARLVGAKHIGQAREESIAATVGRAAFAAEHERRPVIVEYRAEAMRSEVVEPERFAAIARATRSPVAGIDFEAMDVALGGIAASRRPVVLAGRGSVIAGARDALVDLADELGAGLATTLLAKDYFKGHPRNLGTIGTLAWPTSLELAQQADCIIAFGASLGEFTTVNGWLMANKFVVQCDDVAAQIQRSIPVNAAVVGDAKEVAETMTLALRAVGPSKREWALRLSERLKALPNDAEFADQSAEGAVDMRVAMRIISEEYGRPAGVVTDGGRHLYAPWRYLELDDPSVLHQTANFGSIGLSLPVAMGVAYALDREPVLCVSGDGGARMQLSALVDAVALKLDVLWVILNDGAYGAEWNALAELGSDPKLSLIGDFDFAALARTVGAAGHLVRSVDQLRSLAHIEWGNGAGPVLIDVRCDPSVNIRAQK